MNETNKFWGGIVLACAMVVSFGVMAKAAVESGVMVYGQDYIKATPGSTEGKSDAPKRQGWIPVTYFAPIAINISSATTTQIIAGLAGRQILITAFHLVAGGADNVALISGTGATCGSSTTALAGGTTAATGYNLAANNGIAMGTGVGMLFRLTTAHHLCIVTSSTAQLSGAVSYVYY